MSCVGVGGRRLRTIADPVLVFQLYRSNPAGSEATPMHYEPTPPTTRGARSNAQRGGRSRGRGSKRNTRRGSTEGLN